MTNDQSGTPSFLSQFKPPLVHSRLRTTSQLEPKKFCDYVGEVCFFRVEHGKAVMILTDYTEHPLLPFLEGDGRPSGQASIITTLWDEHCQTAQEIDIKVGDLLYLKNLRPKVDADNKIELTMNGFRPGSQGFRPTDPVRKLQPNDPFVKSLRLRKTQYELYLIAQNDDRIQQNGRPVNQGLGGATSKPPRQLQPEPIHPPKSTNQGLGNVSTQPPPQPQSIPTFKPHSTVPPNSALPFPLKVPTTSISPVGASPSSASAATVTTRTQAPPQDIPPAANTPLQREPSSPVAVKRELTRQPSSPIRSRSANTPTCPSSTPAPPAGESVGIEISPTFVLMNKVKQAIRNTYAEGLRFVKLRARVFGFEPANLIDFSGAKCTKCPYKYPPMSECKPPRWCPGCGLEGVYKFEYNFKFKLSDELNQFFTVDIDDEHASTLIGVAAGNMLKNENQFKMVADRLALIGVSNVLDQDEEIFFDCCVRQNIIREIRKEPMGSCKKRTGGSLPSPIAKRHAYGSQEMDEAVSSEPSPSPPPSTEEVATSSTDAQTSSGLTWSLVFTEIKKKDL
ncbi:hypothetical protein BGZ96_002343 [Linnemannia gamsii]|uniref:Protection of telomeres protein 1 ssDNA-binding domain-containing protein n=1 Tax=Linnemannia gamsii TaxID=64522 RepID=A0ABQ7K852_9FUNG|nr:hypothetical protein BGZ96_002343 [Linnemannia gamsii]